MNKLEEVQKLYEKGYRQADIAENLGINQSQVSRDLKEVKINIKQLTNKNNNVLMMGLFISLLITDLYQKFYDYFSIFDMLASLNFDGFI